MIADLYSKTGESNVWGVDVKEGKAADVTELEIFDALETKSWAFKLCFDAVMTLLKIDQIIMSKPSGGPNAANSQAARRPDGY